MNAPVSIREKWVRFKACWHVYTPPPKDPPHRVGGCRGRTGIGPRCQIHSWLMRVMNWFVKDKYAHPGWEERVREWRFMCVDVFANGLAEWVLFFILTVSTGARPFHFLSVAPRGNQRRYTTNRATETQPHPQLQASSLRAGTRRTLCLIETQISVVSWMCRYIARPEYRLSSRDMKHVLVLLN